MHQKIKIILLGALLTLNLQANAQEFYVNNNSEVKALASKTEITRVAFDFPVTEVHSISEEIEYVINGKDIYLRMLNEDKPINFFVKCENENTYKLLLIAHDAPADQIFIHNKAVSGKATRKTEYFGDISPELKQRIAKIIEITLNPTKHLGYKIEKKDKSLSGLFEKIKMKLEILVSDNQLSAEKIKLINKSNSPINLKLSDFAKQKEIAVYLEKLELESQEETILIRIYEK